MKNRRISSEGRDFLKNVKKLLTTHVRYDILFSLYKKKGGYVHEMSND